MLLVRVVHTTTSIAIIAQSVYRFLVDFFNLQILLASNTLVNGKIGTESIHTNEIKSNTNISLFLIEQEFRKD